MSEVVGNVAGLKPSQKKALERTFQRRVSADAIVSAELAKHLAWISRDIGRQVGVLINRRGQVEECFVGENKRLYLPDVGRQRAGAQHRRGLRHVHTVLDGTGLARDDFSDLTKLRLDLVCAVNVSEDGKPDSAHYAYPQPGAQQGGARHDSVQVDSLRELEAVDFKTLIADVEREQARQHGPRQASVGKNAAVLVGVYSSRDDSAWRMAELRELCMTAGVTIADEVVQHRARVDPKYVVGRGKLEEVMLRCLDVGAELIILDHDLSPAQARAIAALSELKVIDRTQLILDIFAQHAQSRDGKLQVELAQLKYTLPRLTDLDAGMSRLTGGIGGRGPGETKLEINRRRARDRITRLEREIERLSEERGLRRERRHTGTQPIVSIVGYTNAGKSTLLNRLTKSDVLVANKLFATLDTTSRRLRLPGEREAIITDTVGFIRELPPDLMRAFRATLEELESADLLLHVVDVSDPMRDEKMSAVERVLDELELGGIPRVVALNKSDLVPVFEAQALARKHAGVAVSAVKGTGTQELLAVLAERLLPEGASADGDAAVAEAGRDEY